VNARMSIQLNYAGTCLKLVKLSAFLFPGVESEGETRMTAPMEVTRAHSTYTPNKRASPATVLP